MKQRINLSLEPTERAVVQAAASIYAAYITTGRVPEGKEQEWMTRALNEAIWIARTADEEIRADSEMG